MITYALSTLKVYKINNKTKQNASFKTQIILMKKKLLGMLLRMILHSALIHIVGRILIKHCRDSDTLTSATRIMVASPLLKICPNFLITIVRTAVDEGSYT